MEDKNKVISKRQGFISKRFILYLLLGVVIFIIALYLGFPYNTIKGKVANYASQESGLKISIKELSPSGIFNFKLKDVKVKSPDLYFSFIIDDILIKPKWLTFIKGSPVFSFDLNSKAIKGNGLYNIRKKTMIVDLNNIDLKRLNSSEKKSFSLSGTLQGKAEISLKERNIYKGEGKISFLGKDIRIENVKILKYKLPSLKINNVIGTAYIKKRRWQIKNIKAEGQGFSAIITGKIIPLIPLNSSILNLKLYLKINSAMPKLIRNFLLIVPHIKGKKGFSIYTVRGSLKNPRLI